MFKEDSSATVQPVFRSLSDSKEVFFAVHHHLDPIRAIALRVDGNEAFHLIGRKQLKESAPRPRSRFDADHGELALAPLGAAEQEHQAGQVVPLQRFHLQVTGCAGLVVEVAREEGDHAALADSPHHHPLPLVVRVVTPRGLLQASQQVVEPLLGVHPCRMLGPSAQNQNWNRKTILCPRLLCWKLIFENLLKIEF